MAQRLSELLSSLPAVRQAQALSVLQKQFDTVLPVRFRGEAQVVALEEGELRVICSNGAIASRLRLEAQNLASQLQKRGVPVRKASLKVQPVNSRRAAPQSKKHQLPAAAHEAFKSAATQMEEGEVKMALQKLLNHHKGN